MKHLWIKFKNWCLQTWHQLDNWQTLILFLLVVVLMYTPVWGGYLLFYLFHWKWAMWMATGFLAFWAAPFTPFFPTCIAITLAVKKAWLHFHDHVKKNVHPKIMHKKAAAH